MQLLKKIIKIIIAIIVIATVLILLFFVIYRPAKVNLADDNSTNKIIVYGDTRSSIKVHNDVVNLIVKEKPDAVIHTGDMIHVTTQFQTWIPFLYIEKKLFDIAEYFPTRGNHENVHWIYTTLFRLPDDRTYYSFDRMGIHFVVMDVQTHIEPMFDEANQMQWLRDDFAENVGKPKIIAMHAPMLTTGKYEPFIKEGLHELFLANDVIATVSAHVHSYERSVKDGINFVVTAGGGAPMYPKTRDSEYSVIRKPFNHYVIITKATDNGSYNFRAVNTSGEEFDNFTTSVKMLNKKALKK